MTRFIALFLFLLIILVLVGIAILFLRELGAIGCAIYILVFVLLIVFNSNKV